MPGVSGRFAQVGGFCRAPIIHAKSCSAALPLHNTLDSPANQQCQSTVPVTVEHIRFTCSH